MPQILREDYTNVLDYYATTDNRIIILLAINLLSSILLTNMILASKVHQVQTFPVNNQHVRFIRYMNNCFICPVVFKFRIFRQHLSQVVLQKLCVSLSSNV